MRRFFAARLAQSVAVVFIAATVTFALVRSAPGDPFAYDAQFLQPKTRAEWRQKFGYDRPIAEQYLRYLGNAARGDFGFSFTRARPAANVIRDALPRTLLLTGVSLALSLLLGIVIGVWRASRRRGAAPRIVSAALLTLYSVPDVWAATLMLVAFSRWIPIFPVGGMETAVVHEYMSWWRAMLDTAYHLALPALTLTLLTTAAIARYQTAALLDVLSLDFVRTARAKGATEHDVVWRHAWRNALVPIVTLIGLLLPALIGGALFVELVFGWPGMGLLTAEAVRAQDYDLVTASVIIGAVLVTLGNLLGDVLHAVVDPRVHVG